MIDIIKNALKEAEIKTWRINEKKEHTAEVFFIRRRQDMRRIRDTHKYNVEVFCDYEKERQADARQVTGHHCAVPVGAGSSDPS